MSIFRNDGNNPLVPLGMVLGMAVLPMAIIGGIVGGALWLGYSAVSAVVSGAAFTLSPGAVLGGIALLAVGHYTGALQGLGYMLNKGFRKLFPKKPQAEKPPAPPTDTWKEMVKDLDAKRAFKTAQENKPAAETPAPAAPAAAPPAP